MHPAHQNAVELNARGHRRQLLVDGHVLLQRAQLVLKFVEANAEGAKAVLLNAGAYTHTSIALLDAIKSIKVPVIEVHLSDPMQREQFRHISYVGMAAVAHFAGHGANSYTLALDAAARL